MASTLPPVITVKKGGTFVWTGDVVQNSITGSSRISIPFYNGAVIATGDNPYFPAGCTAKQTKWVTVDNRIGIYLADDLILEVVGSAETKAVGSGAISGTSRISTNSGTYPSGANGTSGYDFLYSGSGPDLSTPMLGVPYPSLFVSYYSYPASDNLWTQTVTHTSSLQGRIYAGKNFKSTGVNVDVCVYTRPYDAWTKSISVKPIVSGTTTVKYISGLECTISAPPTINFGEVNLWNFVGNSTGQPGGARRDVLAVSDGELGINCNGDSSSKTSGVLTLKGVTRKYTNDLEVRMDATNSLAPATVRASFMNRTSACNSNGTNFATTSGKPDADKVQIAELSAGQTNIPYRFSLCSFPEEGINLFGSASATATMTLNWD